VRLLLFIGVKATIETGKDGIINDFGYIILDIKKIYGVKYKIH
jgi:hypothetical protein